MGYQSEIVRRVTASLNVAPGTILSASLIGVPPTGIKTAFIRNVTFVQVNLTGAPLQSSVTLEYTDLFGNISSMSCNGFLSQSQTISFPSINVAANIGVSGSPVRLVNNLTSNLTLYFTMIYVLAP